MSLSFQKLLKKQSYKGDYDAVQKQPSEQPKVLLIEDDRSLRRIVRANIGDHCDLLMAGNVSLGATLFKTQRPDIAFIDINLPDGNGYSLLDWILKINPNAFAVMFSGHTDDDNVYKSIEIGAKGFVSKPFDVNKMLFFINQCRTH